MTSSGPSPVPVLVVAVVVLLAGVIAAAVHDDTHSPPHTTATTTRPARSSTASTSTSTTVSSSSSSSTSGTSATVTSVATTVRPPVTSPEAAVNGLWAAYSANNQVAAQRFASDDVIRVLFESPYNGEQGSFQGCRPNGDVFDCNYLQPSARYAMTVKRDTANGFVVVELTVTPS